MTTYLFSPTLTSAFVFQPQLDGASYNCTVAWNTYAQRFYLAVFAPSGALIVNIPFVASPNGYDINLLAGYFTSTLVYRGPSNTIVVTP